MFFLKDLPGRRMVEGYARRFPTMDVDATLTALHTMRQASLLVRRLEAYFSEFGLSQLRFLVLIVIDREPEKTELTIREIVDRLDVSKPVMTRTLSKLVDDGLIVVQSSGTDARSKAVHLTETGQSRLAALLPAYFELLSEFSIDGTE